MTKAKSHPTHPHPAPAAYAEHDTAYDRPGDEELPTQSAPNPAAPISERIQNDIVARLLAQRRTLIVELEHLKNAAAHIADREAHIAAIEAHLRLLGVTPPAL